MPLSKDPSSPAAFRDQRASDIRLVAAALTFSATLFALVPTALGHGDVHEGIVATTAELEKTPDRAELYLRRGSLYRTHRDFVEALADFRKAAELSPELTGATLAAGEVLIELARYPEAEQALLEFDRRQPGDARCWAALGRLYGERNDADQSASAYANAVKYSKTPEPHLYLLQSRARQAGGKTQEALQALDDGIKALGPLPVLIEPAVELEVAQHHWPEALSRIETAMAAAPRKERWLVRKASVLEKAGQLTEALQALKLALAEMDSLPPGRRAVPLMRDFEAEVRARIAALEQEPAPTIAKPQ